MIDTNKLEIEFKKYVEKYDPTNERIKLKIDHIGRVAKNCEVIAKNLNLNEEYINLAIAIGYFHDIGRFEQVRIYDTLSDKDSGVNHGEMSIKVLFEDGLIKNFFEDTKYDNIIKKSILNHNQAYIEKGLTRDELLFSKIIRDADKLDIFYLISLEKYSMKSIFWYDVWNDEKISDEIIKDFKTTQYIFYPKIKNNADVIAIFYAYIYDLYFPISLQIVAKNKYLDLFSQRIYKTFSSPIVHEQTKQMLESVNKYLSNF